MFCFETSGITVCIEMILCAVAQPSSGRVIVVSGWRGGSTIRLGDWIVCSCTSKDDHRGPAPVLDDRMLFTTLFFVSDERLMG